MKIASDWKDYRIIATGGGMKLEKWGDVTLLRPDPQVIWKSDTDLYSYPDINAVYRRSDKGGGGWQIRKPFPEQWRISYNDLTFCVKPTGFKHTGLFPEQAVNWNAMRSMIERANADLTAETNSDSNSDLTAETKTAHKNTADKNAEVSAGAGLTSANNSQDKTAGGGTERKIKILNLFAYTGGASVACAKSGAEVVHVDAAKAMVERAGINAGLSGIGSGIRYIVDDCAKFVAREIRRGNKYDGIIMDPPSYGRGPNGEVWKIEDGLFDFVVNCSKLLAPEPLFFLINSYTTGLQPCVIKDVMTIALKEFAGGIDAYEVGLPTDEGIVLPCGCSGMFTGKKYGDTPTGDSQ